MTNVTRNNTDEGGRKQILVIGGTGIVGAPIARALDLAGWNVRVMSRNADQARSRFNQRVELVAGDANHPEEIKRAMGGCTAVLICVSDLNDPYLDLRVTQSVVAVASGLKIERIGMISGPSVAEERRSFPMIDAKYQAEEHLKKGGIPWVIIRPTWPMESLARFVRGNRASILGQQPATIHPVAGADIGRMVAQAFELDEALGHTFTVHGPTACTMKEWLGKGYAGGLDRKLANSIGPVCMRIRLVAMAKYLAEALAESLRAHPGRPAWLINLGGGPASDSLNALILLRGQDRTLLENRPVHICVMDRDDEGPAFAKSCLEALTQGAGPLSGLTVEIEHHRCDWAHPESLLSWFRAHAIADDAVAVSTEGGLFEYGTDVEVADDLTLLRKAVAQDFDVVGSVFRDTPLTRMVKDLGKLTLQPRNRDVFTSLIAPTGWQILFADEGNPMSYVVWLRHGSEKGGRT